MLGAENLRTLGISLLQRFDIWMSDGFERLVRQNIRGDNRTIVSIGIGVRYAVFDTQNAIGRSVLTGPLFNPFAIDAKSAWLCQEIALKESTVGARVLGKVDLGMVLLGVRFVAAIYCLRALADAKSVRVADKARRSIEPKVELANELLRTYRNHTDASKELGTREPLCQGANDSDGIEEPQGIGGWVALVALQAASGALFSILEIFRIAPGLWSPRLVEIRPTTALVFLVTVVSAVLAAWALILLSRKSRLFPTVFIASLLWRVGKNGAELWAISHVAPQFIDPVPLTISVTFAALLVPYVRQSRRVRNTFVR
jgi:Protein of unknown function (DUF2569)